MKLLKDIAPYLAIGLLAYMLDVYTAPSGLYNRCQGKYQLLLLVHHVIFMFNSLGFLSNNVTVLKLNVVSILLTLLHWNTNGHKCFITQTLQSACGNSSPLRTPLLTVPALFGADVTHAQSAPYQPKRQPMTVYMLFALLVCLYKIHKLNSV